MSEKNTGGGGVENTIVIGLRSMGSSSYKWSPVRKDGTVSCCLTHNFEEI